MKKILFLNGRTIYPYALGGDLISAWYVFKILSKKFKIQIIAPIDPQYSFKVDERNILTHLRNSDVKFCDSSNYLKCKLIKSSGLIKPQFYQQINYFENGCNYRLINNPFLLDEFKNYLEKDRPDLIITQMELSEKVLEIGANYGIKTVLFIHDVMKTTYNYLEAAEKYKCSLVIFNSYFCQSKFKNFEGKSLVIYPLIGNCKPNNIVVDRTKNKYITMINPIRIKGGQLLKKIIEIMQDQKFLIVEGWYDSKIDNISFDGYPNVISLSSQINMSKVYGKTKLLLVPTKIEEGFGRVVVEAQAYGIPVIASNKGGLKESVGLGGYNIENINNVQDWINKIDKVLNNARLYNKLSNLAQVNSKKFTIKNNEDNVVEIFKKVLNE